jgi:osmotically-inducible protein OsmY
MKTSMPQMMALALTVTIGFVSLAAAQAAAQTGMTPNSSSTSSGTSSGMSDGSSGSMSGGTSGGTSDRTSSGMSGGMSGGSSDRGSSGMSGRTSSGMSGSSSTGRATGMNTNSRNSSTADNAQNNASDVELMRTIRQALVADSQLSTAAQNVTVVAQNGKVTLRGDVKSEAERTAIVAAATRVVGSSNNIMNELTVSSQ